MSTALRRFIFSTALAAAFSVTTVAAPAKSFAQETDLGPTDASTVVTASLVLKVRFPDLLEAVVALTQEPGLPTYHRFLSTRDFAAIFSPSPSDIATITKYLAGFGIVVTEVYADRLLIRATGTTDAFNQAFAVDVHNFQNANGRHFHRPRHQPKIPLLLRDLLVTVFGPSDEPMFRAHNVRASSLNLPVAPRTPVLPPKGATATHAPGDFTVGDVAERYNVNPLYDRGIDGTGNTVGIITLANMVPQDAYDYWAMIGLNVDQNRITQVHVDGGGELSADAGSGESSLDVEQSGGMAPGAKMVVYDAPNTNASFIDLFYRAASDNLVDTLSVSWGLSEIFSFAAVVGEDDTPQLVAFHQALLEMAVQGISMFASSGDSGAYDGNDAFNDPVDNVLSVDTPGSDPAITSSGGTTVPFTFTLLHPPPNTPPLVVSTERVWAWDYLQDYLVEFVGPQFQDALFPEGGGGGVSIFWKLPAYQALTKGIRKSEPNQSVVFQGEDLLDLPAGFAGRNVPDVSLNADPETGYIIISSADGGFIDGFGGTSFVAPQLNGITNLLVQANGGRLGLMNPMYYRFQRQYGYGKGSPFVDITTGSNWFYDGVKGYEPGAGLGVLNVANLADAINHESGHHH